MSLCVGVPGNVSGVFSANRRRRRGLKTASPSEASLTDRLVETIGMRAVVWTRSTILIIALSIFTVGRFYGDQIVRALLC